ncbi:MAG: acyloxyacyl hydrolase [Cytophagales bacterium]|nr:acyloxyacyl hydrolase [Cytophagales bacterium]
MMLFTCFAALLDAKGQELDTLAHSYFIGIKGHTGFIIPHSKEIIDVSGSKPIGFQLDVSRIDRSLKAWNKCNCYSQVGFSAAYFNYRNPKVLGDSYNLIAYAEPLLTYNPKLNFRLRAGAGLSYLTEIYNAVSNPTNLFFSSTLSGYLMVGVSAHYTFLKNWNANVGVHYNHISNGGLQQPNKGMNFPQFNAGMEYNLNPVNLRPRNVRATFDRTFHGYAGLFGNIRTVQSTATAPTVNKWQLGISGGVVKQFTTMNAWTAGVEFSHDQSVREQGVRDGENRSPFLFSMLVGHQFIFGRFGFSQQMGHYTFRDYAFRTDFFQRYTLTYLIASKVAVGISMKAHGKEAEQMDVRAGYRF